MGGILLDTAVKAENLGKLMDDRCVSVLRTDVKLEAAPLQLKMCSFTVFYCTWNDN